ncbi:MAG: DegT/DnrJ/EryC1/StrS family aminotransferase [Anaerolineae bacterium]|jgi:perosamine synthetase|nr:DegT/DnrJ/EryC1/StrS family aminotransferase [Anaerolineae bacterium]
MKTFIPVYMPDFSGNEMTYVTDCVNSGWISSLGKYVERFETSFAEFCGVKHGIAVSNGTVALHLALLLKDIGPGDEVIIPDLTFVATANVVRYVGAEPVLIDAEPFTWTINPAQIKAKITSKTKAIIPVHLYGHPANMGEIMALANQYGLYVIEDAAEAHGAEYKGKRVGSLGDIGAFSFYGNKVITTGEGGMLVTDDNDLADRARFLKDHAMSKEDRYWHPEVGYNYRITNMQAAIGLAQLERIEIILARKIEIAQKYKKELEGCHGIAVQPEANWAKNIYWMFSILVTDESHLNRNELMSALQEKGIDSRPFFYPIHQLPPYSGARGDFFVAKDLSARGINLPSYPTLSNLQIEFVCQTIRELCKCR